MTTRCRNQQFKSSANKMIMQTVWTQIRWATDQGLQYLLLGAAISVKVIENKTNQTPQQ